MPYNSCRTSVTTNCMGSISHHIVPLVIYSLEVYTHTNTHTHANTHIEIHIHTDVWTETILYKKPGTPGLVINKILIFKMLHKVDVYCMQNIDIWLEQFQADYVNIFIIMYIQLLTYIHCYVATHAVLLFTHTYIL